MNKIDKIKILTIINLVSSLLTMGIGIIISFLLSPYIVKNLGEEANGFTQLANNFIMYASLITTALNSMGARFISINYHSNEREKANKYYSSLIIGNIIIIAILILPALFCIYKLEDILHISNNNIMDVKILFLFVFMTFFATQIIGIFNISTYVTNKLYITNIIGLIKSMLNGILLIILFGIFIPKIYFVSLIGFLLSVFTMILTYEVKKKVLVDMKFSRNNFSIKCIRELIGSGIWNTINQCGNILMTGIDLLIANLLISPIEMGVLSIAKIIPNHIIQLAATINTNFSPALVITYSQGKREEILKQLRTSMKISSVLVSIPIMIFCIYGIEFYELWMPTMDAKVLAILSILTCMAFIPFSGPQVLYNIYTTTNRLGVNAITVIMGGILNCIIVVVMVKFTSLGIYAIAGTSAVISVIRNLLITVPYTGRILGLKWYEFYKDVGISIVCCILCGGVSFIIKMIVVPTGWITLMISIFIACILSLVVNIIFIMDKEEKKNIKIKILKGLNKNG